MLVCQALACPPRQYRRREFNRVKLTPLNRFAQVIKQLSQGGEHCIATIPFRQWLAGGAAQQTVDRGQAQGAGGRTGRHSGLRE
jgi:hypothetical protein